MRAARAIVTAMKRAMVTLAIAMAVATKKSRVRMSRGMRMVAKVTCNKEGKCKSNM